MKTIPNLLLVMTLLMTGAMPAHGQASGPGTAQPAAATTRPIAPETLDKLLAPIALYPDALIVQIVTCAASPYQVKELGTWLKANPGLKGTAAQDAATKQGFDASYVAIVLFPQVVHMMAEKPDWTKELGQAFKTDRSGVFKSIQRLREQAQAMGNLKTNEQQEVQTVKTQSGQQVIVIQPANPQVVYVPQYNPQVVYVQTAPPPPPPSNDGKVAGAGLIGFAAGVIVGAAADDDNDHFHYGYGGWGYRGAAEDFYDHREDMAKDYYDHRENMAGQRNENQGQRQQASAENQAARGDTRTQNQTSRQEAQNQNQSSRQEAQNQNEASRQDAKSQGQASRSENQSARQSSAQQASSTDKAAQRSYQGKSASQAPASASGSGAFSGYQRGSTERASSSRGNSSMSRSGGGGGSGAGRTGGGAGGGGGASRSGGGGGGRR